MPERLKAILDKITAWWKKFNTKDGEHIIPQGASYDDIITILTQK